MCTRCKRASGWSGGWRAPVCGMMGVSACAVVCVSEFGEHDGPGVRCEKGRRGQEETRPVLTAPRATLGKPCVEPSCGRGVSPRLPGVMARARQTRRAASARAGETPPRSRLPAGGHGGTDTPPMVHPPWLPPPMRSLALLPAHRVMGWGGNAWMGSRLGSNTRCWCAKQFGLRESGRCKVHQGGMDPGSGAWRVTDLDQP
jgi:hypothetical protein